MRIYQRSRSVLVPAAVVAVVLVLLASAAFSIAASTASRDVFELGVVLAAAAVGVPAVFVRALFLPMLTLNDSYLIYRRTAIPWARILDAFPMQFGGMECMGIKIADGQTPLLYLTKSAFAQKALAQRNDFLLQRNGALVVPAARGLSIPELCDRVNEFRLTKR